MQKKSGLFVFTFLLFVHLTFSQNTDTKEASHFGTAVTVTNKGISFIPNLALGKPAIIFDFSVGNERFSFDPQFRFALEGKPWSFLFWFRYKIAESINFSLALADIRRCRSKKGLLQRMAFHQKIWWFGVIWQENCIPTTHFRKT